MKLFKNKLFWILIIAAVAVFSYFKFFKQEKNTFTYLTTKVVRGDISKQITANGTINPVNLVKVGTQVSGIIEKIFVDFNDNVVEGQVLAEIDTSVLQSQLEIAKANLDKAKANLDLAKLEYDRADELFKKDYVARSELDQADVNYRTALANYTSSESEYKRAEINLGYAIIKSPVSGVVISREVDEGQTVAATFSSPDLFKIAVDLSKMQVEAAVSEADIGMIKSGQVVSFTVDAYPREIFYGVVDNIRLNPVSESNVVTYTVIIKIDNEDLRLIPGMTAYLNIVIESAENVLKVSNAVFNFLVPEADPNALTGEPNKIMYRLKDGKTEKIEVQKGIIADTETEIISDQVSEGDEIVEDYIDTSLRSSSTFNMGRTAGRVRR
ncbi:MAG: efflux RND transporter periplasmic adaptor subunit [Rickettsiales bacterium]|nr:efflux RND transporter periplasmic adaptor subunit [Rickettsiales bacterium]